MRSAVALGILVASVCGCHGGEGSTTAIDASALDAGSPDAIAVDAFVLPAECEGQAIVPLQGQHQMVISFLEIGELQDGFDLDGDGVPDNQVAAIGSLAGSAIDDAFDDFAFVMPIELFDYPVNAADDCVKLAFYRAFYRLDRDTDLALTAGTGGDCNDTDDAIHPSASEVPGNHKDDDCDGLADESDDVPPVPSDNTDDLDGDGVTIADGDCDDTNGMVKGPSMAEICGDGLDNDCDGVADYTLAAAEPACTPYDAETPDELPLDATSLYGNGAARYTFQVGATTEAGAGIEIHADAGTATFFIPTTSDLTLEFPVSHGRLVADLVSGNAGIGMVAGRIGGVLAPSDLEQVHGLDVAEIGIVPEDSFLDAIFANIFGPIFALPSLPSDSEWAGCRTPDIDMDGDGLEAFCDSDPNDEVNRVDVCVDGDGTVVYDEVNPDSSVTQCTDAVDEHGQPRFVDGVSIELNFEAVPAILAEPL